MYNDIEQKFSRLKLKCIRRQTWLLARVIEEKYVESK